MIPASKAQGGGVMVAPGDIRPVVGRAVPEQPRPGRSINLGEIRDQFGRILNRIESLEKGQVQFFADCRKRLGAEIDALKKTTQEEVGALYVAAEERARVVAAKIDERYAGKFAQVEDALKVLASGCDAMSEAHKLIADASTQSNKAAQQAVTMAAKIDILAGNVDQIKRELGSELDAVQANVKAAADKAVADAAAALKLANQAAKDVQGSNGRLVKVEGVCERLSKAGTGRR
jgi:hypothetical protein